MKIEHITEVFAEAFEKKILEEWRHEGEVITQAQRLEFELDGKRYLVKIEEQSEAQKTPGGGIRRQRGAEAETARSRKDRFAA